MSLVLDGSLALAWCFDDEATPMIDEIMNGVAKSGAVVPSIWRLEVANGLLMGVRRKRMSHVQRDAMVGLLAGLDIMPDLETDRYAWSATMALAERYGLSVYDASYLELARRRSLLLATLDKALRTAATAAGVELVL